MPGQSLWRAVVARLAVVASLALVACHPADEDAPGAVTGASPTAGALMGDGARTGSAGLARAADEVVARVGDEMLDLAELDWPLRIVLHDLEMARHRVRRERLDAWIRERVAIEGGEGVAIEDRLEPPEPPRFDLLASDAIVTGPAEAPIVVTHFVDFASAHSRRLQPVLATLAARYPERVRIEERQLPLPYHRYARPAAEAARCAQHQGVYAAYRDVLLMESDAGASETLRRHAERVGLEGDRFAACLADGEAGGDVDRDLSLAASIGVTRAATVFVNGLYLSGRPDLETLEAVVRSELRRMGYEDAPRRTRRASASGQRDPGSGTPPVPDVYFEDPDLVIALSRELVARAFEDRRALEAALEPTRSEYGGHRLLKLRDVAPDGLFDRLALEPGDVVLAVDGEFVTARRNVFFEALERGGVVRVIVMRHGRPRKIEIRIGSGA